MGLVQGTRLEVSTFLIFQLISGLMVKIINKSLQAKDDAGSATKIVAIAAASAISSFMQPVELSVLPFTTSHEEH